MRIYADMTRSHLKVWRDQVDGHPTGDFIDEFNAKIDECDYFLILDSRNYRKRSNWCLEELKRFNENWKNRKNREIIVCLLEEDGDWRSQFKDAEHEAYFAKINRLKYYKFFHEGTYDNEAVYRKSMSAICSMFDEHFVPWSEIPETRDLEDEINNSTEVKLSDEDRNNILRGYEYIRHEIQRNQNVKSHFELWIDDCKSYGLNLLFPRLVYIIWLSDEKHKGAYNEFCYSVLEQLVKEFPKDARCHYSLGIMATKLDSKDDTNANDKSKVAVSALLKTIELLEKSENDWLKEHMLFDAQIAAATAYININEFGIAWNYLTNAYHKMLKDNRFNFRLVRLVSICLKELGNQDLFLNYLQDLLEKYPLESELHSEYGIVYLQKRKYELALPYFEKAYALAPNVENGFYILLCESRLKGLPREFQEFANSLLARPKSAFDDDKWKAAIYCYIYSNEKKAREICPGREYELLYN